MNQAVWFHKKKNKTLTNDTNHRSRRIRSWDYRRRVCCIQDKSRSGFPTRHESGMNAQKGSSIHGLLPTPWNREPNPSPHHVGTDGLGYYAAHGRLHGRGGRQHRCRREQRWSRRSWRKRRRSRRQDGHDGGKHGWRLGHPRLIPRAGFADRSPGRGRSGV